MMTKKEIQKSNKDNKDYIIKMYLDGKTPDEIGKIWGIQRRSMYQFIKNTGIKMRTKSESQKFDINSLYFNKIDSIDKAYFLGWLMADGNVNDKNKVTSLTLKESDIKILEMFRKHIASNGNINTYASKQSNFLKRYSTFSFLDKKIYDDLNYLGVIPRKSLVLDFPKELVPEHLIYHFIRGYFEGDGSIGIYKEKNKDRFQFSVLGTKQFLSIFIDFFKKYEIEFNLDRKKDWKLRNINTYRLYTSSRIDVIKILDIIYKDCEELFLDRKYVIYQEMKNIFKIKGYDDKTHKKTKNKQQFS